MVKEVLELVKEVGVDGKGSIGVDGKGSVGVDGKGSRLI